LVGEAGGQRDGGDRLIRVREPGARKRDPQLTDVVARRTAEMAAEGPSQVRRVNADGPGDIVE
jgi:hypothetical protein